MILQDDRTPEQKSTHTLARVGDRVKYSARWLRSVGMYTGPIPFTKGTITAIENGIATIAWEDPDIPAKVHIANLSIVGRPEPA